VRYLDGPVCVRELKPGVPREGHLLTDHADPTSGREILAPGEHVGLGNCYQATPDKMCPECRASLGYEYCGGAK
jgi:hypothetical protein